MAYEPVRPQFNQSMQQGLAAERTRAGAPQQMYGMNGTGNPMGAMNMRGRPGNQFVNDRAQSEYARRMGIIRPQLSNASPTGTTGGNMDPQQLEWQAQQQGTVPGPQAGANFLSQMQDRLGNGEPLDPQFAQMLQQVFASQYGNAMSPRDMGLNGYTVDLQNSLNKPAPMPVQKPGGSSGFTRPPNMFASQWGPRPQLPTVMPRR